MLPLLFPWFLVVVFIFAILLSLFRNKKKWIAVILLLMFALILNWWAECIPFKIWPLNDTGGGNHIIVMSFNIAGTNEDFNINAPKLVQQIRTNAPDIIFVSEISDKNKPHLDTLLLEDYPYYSSAVDCWNCFYSKYPLAEWEIIVDEEGKSAGIYKCETEIGTDTLILYGCHFASNNYTTDLKYITPDSINSHKDLRQYISDIQQAYSVRNRQAEIIFDEVLKKQHPVIVLGDMNDVGGSTTIRNLEKAGLKDAWWKGGFGYGATIHWPLPYRIDHILYSDELELTEIKVIDSEGLSDHDALFARFVF